MRNNTESVLSEARPLTASCRQHGVQWAPVVPGGMSSPANRDIRQQLHVDNAVLSPLVVGIGKATPAFRHRAGCQLPEDRLAVYSLQSCLPLFVLAGRSERNFS